MIGDENAGVEAVIMIRAPGILHRRQRRCRPRINRSAVRVVVL